MSRSASFRLLIVPSCTAGLCSILCPPPGLSQRGGSRSFPRTTEEPRGWDKVEVVEVYRGGVGQPARLLLASRPLKLKFQNLSGSPGSDSLFSSLCWS